MTIKKALLLSSFFLIAFQLFGQDSVGTKVNKLSFESVQQGGLYYNGTNVLPELLASAGVSYRKFDYMIGTGIDISYIPYRSHFADVRFYPFKQRKFYLEGQAGIANLLKKEAFLSPANKVWTNGNSDISKKVSPMATMLIGYKALLGKETFYNVSLFYNYTRLAYNETYLIPGDITTTGLFYNEQLKYGLRVGLSF